jgi:hypothetical protein
LAFSASSASPRETTLTRIPAALAVRDGLRIVPSSLRRSARNSEILPHDLPVAIPVVVELGGQPPVAGTEPIHPVIAPPRGARSAVKPRCRGPVRPPSPAPRGALIPGNIIGRPSGPRPGEALPSSRPRRYTTGQCHGRGARTGRRTPRLGSVPQTESVRPDGAEDRTVGPGRCLPDRSRRSRRHRR